MIVIIDVMFTTKHSKVVIEIEGLTEEKIVPKPNRTFSKRILRKPTLERSHRTRQKIFTSRKVTSSRAGVEFIDLQIPTTSLASSINKLNGPFIVSS